jgi:hypothetical protein
MNDLTDDAVREIELLHSNWIEFEIAGDDHSSMALCADDIELWPPDARPLLVNASILCDGSFSHTGNLECKHASPAGPLGVCHSTSLRLRQLARDRQA